MAYEKFYEYRSCAKCGSYHRKVDFHPMHTRMLYEAVPDCMTFPFDHMLVRCDRCGYAVVELPLDAEP